MLKHQLLIMWLSMVKNYQQNLFVHFSNQIRSSVSQTKVNIIIESNRIFFLILFFAPSTLSIDVFIPSNLNSLILSLVCWVVINSHRHLKDNRFKFDVTKLSTDDMLLDGQLWLYRDENLNIAARNETYTVTVYSIHKEPGQKKKLTLLSSKQLTDDHWAWLSFNVTSALEEWTHKSHQRSQHEGHQWNHGLLIKVSSLATGECLVRPRGAKKKTHVSARARTGDLSRVRRAW